MALKRAIEAQVRAGDLVVDAGAGTGILSIWAARAGARRVMAVDVADLELARRLVRLNGVEDRVTFHQDDLEEFAPPDPADVLLAMVYFNDPRRDEAQARLVARLARRVLAPGGRLIPNRVVYAARAVDWPEQDYSSRLVEERRQLAEASTAYDVDLSPLADELALEELSHWFPQRGASGMIESTTSRTLSRDDVAFEVDYGALAPYPSEVSLAIVGRGRATAIVWTQRLYCGDSELFANESLSWLRAPVQVAQGSRLVVQLDDGWRRTSVLDRVSRWE